MVDHNPGSTVAAAIAVIVAALLVPVLFTQAQAGLVALFIGCGTVMPLLKEGGKAWWVCFMLLFVSGLAVVFAVDQLLRGA